MVTICSALRSTKPEIDFENEGGETYICGNPPYLGTKYQSQAQKADLTNVFAADPINCGNLDYVGGVAEDRR